MCVSTQKDRLIDTKNLSNLSRKGGEEIMFSREWSERSRVLWIQGSNSILHLACRDTLRCLSSLASLDLLLPLFFRLLPSSLSLAHWLTYSVETKGATGVGRKRERKRVRRGRARAEAKGWKERRKKRRKGPFFFPLCLCPPPSLGGGESFVSGSRKGRRRPSERG